MRCTLRRRAGLIVLCVLMVIAVVLPVSAMEKQKALVITGSVIYKAPSLTGTILTEVARGSEVTVLDYKNKFYAVKYGKYEGYMSENCLRLKGVCELVEGRGTINANEVNLRLKPSLGAQIVIVLKKGTMVQLSSIIDNWYEVDTGKNIGYVHSDYVDVEQDALLKISYSTLRMGMSGKDVLRLQEALKVLGMYKGVLSGNYGALTREGVKVYQESKGIKADGIATGETQQLLFAQVYSVGS